MQLSSRKVVIKHKQEPSGLKARDSSERWKLVGGEEFNKIVEMQF